MNLQSLTVKAIPHKRRWMLALVAAVAILWAGSGMAMQIDQGMDAGAAPAIACSGPCSDPGGGG